MSTGYQRNYQVCILFYPRGKFFKSKGKFIKSKGKFIKSKGKFIKSKGKFIESKGKFIKFSGKNIKLGRTECYIKAVCENEYKVGKREKKVLFYSLESYGHLGKISSGLRGQENSGKKIKFLNKLGEKKIKFRKKGGGQENQV